VVVSILVLKEALCVKSFSDDKRPEFFLQTIDKFIINYCWISLSIERSSSGIAEGNVNRSLEVFLCEDFIDAVTEVFPENVRTFFWGLEMLSEYFEFVSREHDLCHVETNSELSLCDASRSELVKVSKEFADSDSLLFASLSQFGQNVLNIIWDIFLDIDTCNSWLGFWIVIK